MESVIREYGSTRVLVIKKQEELKKEEGKSKRALEGTCDYTSFFKEERGLGDNAPRRGVHGWLAA